MNDQKRHDTIEKHLADYENNMTRRDLATLAQDSSSVFALFLKPVDFYFELLYEPL